MRLARCEILFPIITESCAELLILDIIEYMSSKPGVKWVKMEDICDDFKSKHKPATGALLPADHGAITRNPGERQ